LVVTRQTKTDIISKDEVDILHIHKFES